MDQNTAARSITYNGRKTRLASFGTFAPFALLVALVGLCVFALESRFHGLSIEYAQVNETPVSIYKTGRDDALPPVIIAHGFSGSRQMMDQIAVSLARQGFVVASLDFPGHGRNRERLSPDVTRIEGTTAQLVRVVQDVADAMLERPDTAGPVSFVGHSMATDVVIRAAQARSDVGGVVAISMYSPAVTETSPEALLVVSGAWETHLRRAGLESVQQIRSDAVEGSTVSDGQTIRRTAVAPFVGHVGVLFSSTTLGEVVTWLRAATGTGRPAALDNTGWIAGVLFVALVLVVRPVARFVPRRAAPSFDQLPWRRFLFVIIAPMPVIALIAALPVFGIIGNAGFGTLTLIFGVWGTIQIVLLHRTGVVFERPDWIGTFIYAATALVFALALDRYGAAFLPVGDRLYIMLGVLIGAMPLMIADTHLVCGGSFLRRVLARMALLLALSVAMAMSPAELGLTFSVLPVLVLFFFVYGTMASWIAARRGQAAVGIGKAVVLAWAVAASTPLFSVAG